MTDPRIDPLPRSAVVTDTHIRLTFAPADQLDKVTAISAPLPALKLTRMQSLMQLGAIHIQIKAPFTDERHLQLSGPELMVLMEMADRFVTELPRAQAATPE